MSCCLCFFCAAQRVHPLKYPYSLHIRIWPFEPVAIPSIHPDTMRPVRSLKKCSRQKLDSTSRCVHRKISEPATLAGLGSVCTTLTTGVKHAENWRRGVEAWPPSRCWHDADCVANSASDRIIALEDETTDHRATHDSCHHLRSVCVSNQICLHGNGSRSAQYLAMPSAFLAHTTCLLSCIDSIIPKKANTNDGVLILLA